MSQETMQPDLAVHNVLLSVLRLKVKAHLKVRLTAVPKHPVSCVGKDVLMMSNVWKKVKTQPSR